MRQVKFDELRGLKGLKRDDRYQIRVTLCYYKPTTNGIVDDAMITDIVQKLIKSESLGRVNVAPQQSQPQTQPQAQQYQAPPQQQQQPIRVAPPSMPAKPVVNIPKKPVIAADYQVITGAIKELDLSSEYIKIFQNENVTDKQLSLLQDQDLNVLFPTLGARVQFRAWLEQNRGKLKGQNKNIDKNEYRSINNIFRTLNVANAQNYVSNFMNYGITDKMLVYLLNNDKDLQLLIPDMKARVLFKGYLAKQQQVATRPAVTMPQQPMMSTMQMSSHTGAPQQFLF